MLVLLRLAWRDPLKRTALPPALGLQIQMPLGSSLRKNGGGGREMPASFFWGRLWASAVPVLLGVPQLAGGGRTGGPGCNVVMGKGVLFPNPTEPPMESSLL